MCISPPTPLSEPEVHCHAPPHLCARLASMLCKRACTASANVNVAFLRVLRPPIATKLLWVPPSLPVQSHVELLAGALLQPCSPPIVGPFLPVESANLTTSKSCVLPYHLFCRTGQIWGVPICCTSGKVQRQQILEKLHSPKTHHV